MTDKDKLKLLIDAIDYSFWNPVDEAYNKELTYPVIDKVKYIKRLMEEPVSEDLKKELPKVWDRETLDEYAYQVAYDISNDWAIDNPTWEDVEDACKLGAKWQFEKMMAKGIDGVVHHFEKSEVASIHYSDPTGVPMSYFMSSKGFLAGDKVKIIVIKKD